MARHVFTRGAFIGIGLGLTFFHNDVFFHDAEVHGESGNGFRYQRLFVGEVGSSEIYREPHEARQLVQ